MGWDEQRLLDWLKTRFRAKSFRGIGIGDDAAVVPFPGKEAVLKVDQLVEGIHFSPGKVAWKRLGRKALFRPMSDFAAIGAVPRFFLMSIAFPGGKRVLEKQIREIILGAVQAGKPWKTELVGGDLSRTSGPRVISVFVVGELAGKQPLLRSHAQPGHRLLVTGRLGGSVLRKHLEFVPRLREGAHLARTYPVGGMMDISDGLALDLFRMCEASRVGARLFARQIPLSADARLMGRKSGRSAVDHALSDGEDYELLFTLPPRHLGRILGDPAFGRCGVREIGAITKERKMSLVDEFGRVTALSPWGYLHRG